MIQLKPFFILLRLLVLKGGNVAYDEQFHRGVNIIRSEGNSRGKSTIADLIFYVLGGDITTWKEEAASCDSVYAELLINGAVVTIRRDIAEAGQQPMCVFIGELDSGISTVTNWQKFPYRRYGDKESFTQILFRIMQLPEVPSDNDANITMHQILRLMYVDQMTPVDRIFRFEAKDSPLRRQAVGDLLCGVYDPRIYATQLELRQKEKAYEVIDRQLSGLQQILDRVEQNTVLEMIETQRSNVEGERATILAEIRELKSHRFSANDVKTDNNGIINDLKRDLDKLNRDIVELQGHATETALSIEDAKMLITEIERSLSQLNEGAATSEIFGSALFSICPSCLSSIEPSASIHVCHLCKSKIDPKADETRYPYCPTKPLLVVVD